jgi:hypothetical protein
MAVKSNGNLSPLPYLALTYFVGDKNFCPKYFSSKKNWSKGLIFAGIGNTINFTYFRLRLLEHCSTKALIDNATVRQRYWSTNALFDNVTDRQRHWLTVPLFDEGIVRQGFCSTKAQFDKGTDRQHCCSTKALFDRKSYSDFFLPKKK